LFIKNIAGYKIVIIGRVNGRKKTRLLSIRNSKESNSQQTWIKQVNFGTAQARGRIGTFGIKI
jgi:ribosomal protein S3